MTVDQYGLLISLITQHCEQQSKTSKWLLNAFVDVHLPIGQFSSKTKEQSSTLWTISSY